MNAGEESGIAVCTFRLPGQIAVTSRNKTFAIQCHSYQAWPSGDSIGVTWSASNDELAGQRDVKSYSVYRRDSAGGSWGTPIYTVPGAGTTTYLFQDKTVPLGQTYQYGVVARDCTPALSALTASATVTPNP